MGVIGQSPSDPVNFALIGVGGIGKRHLQCIEAMERMGRASLVAVVDPSPERLQHTLPELHQRGVRWYSHYQQLLESEKYLHAVAIATPIPLHFEMTAACMARDLHILLEKPSVPLIQQLRSLMNMERVPRAAVAFQWICSREIRRLKEMIMEGRLGEIEHIRMSACWPRRDSYYDRADWAGRMMLNGEPVFDGPATNGLAHVLHSAMFLLGEDFPKFGRLQTIQAEIYRARPIEGYDLINLLGKSAGGTVLQAALSHAVREHRPYRIDVRGTRGWAQISMDGTLLETDQGRVMFNEADNADPFIALYRDFLDFVQGRVERPASTLGDTEGHVLATNGALLSSRGVHSIKEPWARKYVSHDETGWTVEGIEELIDRSFVEGKLFSEVGVPWAVSGSTIDLDQLTYIPFENSSDDWTERGSQ